MPIAEIYVSGSAWPTFGENDNSLSQSEPA